MRWLSDFATGFLSIFDWSGLLKPVQRRGLGMLDFLRKKKNRVWKMLPALKISPRTRHNLMISGVGALAMLAVISVGLYMRPRARGAALPEILGPQATAPVLPVFKPEVMATDPAAPARAWRYIVIHHSASTRGNAQIFDQAHRERGWRCLGYHFVIGNGMDQGDGAIVAGPRWYSQEAGAHAHSTEHNEFGIGICLVGNFDTQQVSPAQWSALVTLVSRLAAKYKIPLSNIVGHGQIRQGGSTACPGKNLHLQALRDAVGGSL